MSYSELFINHFIQTLAQLSAVIVSGSLGVPVYNYYLKSYKNSQINNNENDVVLVNENNDSNNRYSNSSTFTDDTLPMDNFNDFRMEESDVIINH